MQQDHLSATFAALADPTRRAILARLALGETTVAELGKPFKMSGPAVSKHLKVLERAGLISRGREAQWRPCKLEAAPLAEGEHFIFQLIDNDVVDEQGTVLGRLVDILETGANEVYVIKRPSGPDLLLPNIPSVVLAIDTAAKRITVHPDDFL